MFTRLTRTLHDQQEAGRTYRKAVDRSIGLEEAKVRALVDNVFRPAIR